MDNIPEAITAKEGKEIELLEGKEYSINSEKDSFQVKIAKNKDQNKIFIKLSKLNELIDIFYETTLTLEEMMKLDKMFRAYDDLEELYESFKAFFEEDKVMIKEVKDDSITMGLKISSMTGKEKIVEIKIYKKEKMKDNIIKELCVKINKLEEENKNLKNEIKTIRNDLDELKKWKNEKEDDMKKLIKIKKNNITELIDSKILTKKEEFEFIEKAYKNDNEIAKNKDFKPKLLYRATRDGDSASIFHNKCDKISGTMTLVKTKKGYIFGGCTDATWDGSGYKKDDKAICFSIDLNKVYKSKKTNSSIYCGSNYGPVFGDYFFCIYDKCFTDGGLINDGLNERYDNQQKKNEINFGNGKFTVGEVEVFEIIFE